jgi:hypothetical protein
MAIDRIGVGDSATLCNMTRLKRYALFFDKIQIAAHTFGRSDVRDFNKGFVSDCSAKADFDFLSDRNFLSFFDTIELWKENFRDVTRQRPGIYRLPPDLEQRYTASRLRDQGADAVCLGIWPAPVWWYWRPEYWRPAPDRSVDRIATRDLLYEIIIDGIPIPRKMFRGKTYCHFEQNRRQRSNYASFDFGYQKLPRVS